MKVLEVQSMEAGINETIHSIKLLSKQFDLIENNIRNFTSLNDSFKGDAGESIQSFYKECHLPLLKSFKDLFNAYENVLHQITDGLYTIEPDSNGFIRESFLEGDLEPSLDKVKNFTIDLTNVANQIMQQVQHIVSLPRLNDENVLEYINQGKKEIHSTIEEVHSFDWAMSGALLNIETSIQSLNKHITSVQSIYRDVGVSSYRVGSLKQYKSDIHIINNNLEEKQSSNGFNNIYLGPNGKVTLDPSAPFSNVGNTVNTVAEAAVISSVFYKTQVQGFAIEKYKAGYKVKNGMVNKINGTNYQNTYISSQLERGNEPQIARYVQPKVAAKYALKNGLSWVGVGVTTGHNLYENVQADEKVAKTIGDAAIDVSIGVATIVGGAVVTSFVVAAGLPVLTGALIGAGVSIGASVLLDGIKVGGKSISNHIKDGVQKGISTVTGTVAGWFKKEQTAK
ncbi:LXG domain-containing protein [Alkalihalophilus pseudofirmus]|uniref:LXG domain-containing protein n=1 Tax=Alkalihalophilus pseudofirmus TaxID=79885 RepID=UPI00259BB10A|nr:LXG domain-containing protein [Alkalihalophilus pseudofirmus]WEG15248.1 LXG domain-containing protein [Alkalihalophilus pseudofirmus]